MFLARVIRKSRKRDQTRPAKRTPGTFLSATSNPKTSLFLGSLGLGLLPHTLLPDTHQAGVGPRLPEGLVGTALDVLGQGALGDLAEAGGDGLGNAEGGGDVLCGLAGLLVLRGVGLLGLVGLAGEDNQAGLVGLEALDVGREGLLGEVLAAGIDGDADGGGVELGNASGLVSPVRILLSSIRNSPRALQAGNPYLQLSQGEATAEACPAVILDGAAHRVRGVVFQNRALGVKLTGIGQSGGACRPGEGRQQRPSHGVPDGARPSCRAVFHQKSEYGPSLVVILCLAIARTWSKWHRTRRCHCLRKSEKSRQRPRPPRNILLVAVVGSCSRVLGSCWLCLIAWTPQMH